MRQVSSAVLVLAATLAAAAAFAQPLDPSLYADASSRMVALQKQLAQIDRALSAAEESWLALIEQWEAATRDASDGS
jgi:hypothetical protein